MSKALLVDVDLTVNDTNTVRTTVQSDKQDLVFFRVPKNEYTYESTRTYTKWNKNRRAFPSCCLVWRLALMFYIVGVNQSGAFRCGSIVLRRYINTILIRSRNVRGSIAATIPLPTTMAARSPSRFSWVRHKLPISTVADPDSWPPRNHALRFDWSSPTVAVYRDTTHGGPDIDDAEASGKMDDEKDTVDSERGAQHLFAPTYSAARSRLDYSYHTVLVLNRQLLQDAIMDRVIASTSTTSSESDSPSKKSGEVIGSTGILPLQSMKSRRKPWIVFTAGPMGVGKGYVLTQLQQANLFPLDQYIKIDPDMIKSELPEMAGYLQSDQATAATKVP